MLPAIDNLVLPDTTGMAIDDEYTRTVYESLTWVARRNTGGAALALIVGVALAVLANHWALGLAAALSVFGCLVVVGRLIVQFLRGLPIQRRLITTYPWRPVRLTGANRTTIQVESDGDIHYFAPATRTGGARVPASTVRHEQLWLCGPDPAGFVRVRAAGQISSQLYRRLDQEPNIHAFDAYPRPNAREQSAAGFRRYLRQWLTGRLAWALMPLLFGVLVVLAGLHAAHPFVALVIGETAIGLSLPLLAMIANQLPSVFRYRRQLVNQPYTTPLRLTAVTRGKTLLVRVEGDIDAPDGSALTLRVPRTGLGLVANVRAGTPVELYGELAPGRTVTVILAGQTGIGARAHVLRS